MIIGSHNSWSYLPIKQWWLKPFNWIAKCQEKDIEAQYNEGARCFDLRIKFDDKGRLSIAHGLVSYDISYEDLMLDLGWLNDKGDCYVRLIHEVRTKRAYTEDKVNLFRKYCEAFESRFPCIKFWSGRNLYDYYEDYKFWYQPTCLELYSSVVFPNIPYPKGYAKTHNKSNICLAKHTNYDILLIDFVNIRE